MATTTFNALAIPGTDDNMEMSSPAQRPLDDDIDIDFDDYTGGVHVTDNDEHMIEDIDPQRPSTATDDMMEDDILPGEQTLVEEQVMQDDAVHDHGAQQDDEELIDYGEDEVHHPDVIEINSMLEQSDYQHEDEEEPADGGISTEPAILVPEEVTPAVAHEVSDEISRIQKAQKEEGDAEDGDGVNVEADDAGEEQDFEEAETADPDAHDEQEVDDKAEQPPISVNTAVSTRLSTPDTPTDTGLHPMTVRYGDMHMPLFKSRSQPDGLLKDDNLANLSLAELVKHCRQRIAVKIGEELSEEQELILGFDNMGLMLVEDSRAAFESSLNDVLDVYLQLHRNDEVHDVPPLSLTLSLQLKFASSFSILKQAAAGGQGMSNFGFLQQGVEDEFDDGEFGDEYDETDEGKGSNLLEYQGNAEQYQEGEHTGEEGEGEYEEYYQDYEEQPEDGQDGTYHDDQSQAPPGLEDLLSGEHQLTDTINNTLDNSALTGDNTVPQTSTAHLEAALGPAHDPDSRASSTTVQGDVAGQAAYDVSANAEDGQDDFSTFLTEFDTEEGRVGAEKADQPSVEAHNLSSEDFLHDLGEQDNEYADQDGEEGEEEEFEQVEDQDYANEGQEEEEEEGETQYYQADNYNEQQYDTHEAYHPDNVPGDGDEDGEFHTAQDFLDCQYYGQGHALEHDGEEEGLDDTVDTVVHHPVDDIDDTPEDFEDDIGFEEEEDDGHLPPTSEDARLTAAGTGAGSGQESSKRSFDEHAGEDELDPYDDREAKRSRAG